MIGLVPLVGTGTFQDAFRPADWDGSGYIDLRAPEQSAGVCLVEQPIIPAARRLGDALDDVLSAPARNRLEAIGHTPPSGATVREAIVDLLLTPPPTLLRALRPSIRGQYEIWLRGVLIFTLPVISGGTILTESFNKADAITLGPDQVWTSINNDAWEVFSNEARIPSASSGDQAERVDADLATDDHYCQANVTTAIGTTPTRYVDTITRKDSTATLTYYLGGRLTLSGATNHWMLYKRVAGTFTELAILNEAEPATPYTIRTESDGSTQRMLAGGVEKLSVTDTAITGNLRCGIHGFRDTGGIISLDVWEAGDLAAGAAAPFNLALAGVGR